MIRTTWHVLVNISIGWWYVYRTAHAFCGQMWVWSHLETDVHKVELFICEDSSFVQQKCIRVLCAVTLSTEWLCLTLPNGCNVGAGIWRSANSWHTLQWIFHVYLHKNISGCKWTVHDWTQLLDCEGMSQAYKDLWVYSALNFVIGLGATNG